MTSPRPIVPRPTQPTQPRPGTPSPMDPGQRPPTRPRYGDTSLLAGMADCLSAWAGVAVFAARWITGGAS